MLKRMLAMVGMAACAAGGGEPAPDTGACRFLGAQRALPAELWETSGLALSGRWPGVIWTHNDSGNEPIFYALDTAGTLVGRVRIPDVLLRDWEDIAAGPCDAGTCLFIGDIGDNGERRDSISIYVVPEPSPTDSTATPVARLDARYPDRAQDAEAMFVLPTGDLYVVTKGRRDSVALYRLPKAAQVPGTIATLERVRALWPRPSSGMGRVTGATTSRDARWVAIRSYDAMYVFATDSLLGAGMPSMAYDLRRLRERQGESITMSDSGEVWLTSEGKGRGGLPTMSELSCTLP